MFERHPLFGLVVDEVEKALYQTDLSIAADYASLVTDADARYTIFAAIKTEHARASAAVRSLTGDVAVADRFPRLRDRFDRKRKDLDRINRLQVALLRQSRNQEAPVSIPLLQSMNSISAALGWTG